MTLVASTKIPLEGPGAIPSSTPVRFAVFWRQRSSGWPQIPLVAQDDPKVRSSCLHLIDAGITGKTGQLLGETGRCTSHTSAASGWRLLELPPDTYRWGHPSKHTDTTAVQLTAWLPCYSCHSYLPSALRLLPVPLIQ